MPIRINLKELFPADAQEISIDKINFNFNKLLELGIGEQGLRGFLGNQGSAGPGGIQGPTGTRGTIWFVGSGNPTLVDDPNSPEDLLPGDLYLDAASFSVWQWDGTSWNFLFNLTAIINNYLAASPSPFTRGLGIGSPNDDRFILFNQRSDNITDVTLGGVGGNIANNDILFLNNFDEDTMAALIPPGFTYGPAETPVLSQIDTETLYNSLFSIYVDHRFSTIGRYHLELGDLYADTSPNPNPILTTVYENYKMRYVRVIPPSGVYADHYNIAQFSLDIPDGAGANSRDFSGVFEFTTPNYNTVGINESAQVYIGSKYGLDEIITTAGSNLADGILFYSGNGGITGANIGLAKNYEIANLPPETGYVLNGPATQSYFMLTPAAGLAGIYLNDSVLQNSGNIIQLATTEPRLVDVEGAAQYSPTSFLGHMGIARDGNMIYTVSGHLAPTDLKKDQGYFNKFTIENPNNPISEDSLKHFGQTYNANISPASCADSYSVEGRPIGAGAADIAIAGKYMYIVHSQNFTKTPNATASSNQWYRTYFQICELDDYYETSPRRIARIGYGAGDDYPELNSAYRVQIVANHAVVASNALDWIPSTTFTLQSLGGVATINIADPDNLSISDSAVPLLFESVGGIPYVDNAILDMDIVDDKVITLTWQQNAAGSAPVTDYQVRVDVFSLNSNSGDIAWSGLGQANVASDIKLNFAAYNAKSKHGAIVANKKYIYAGYEDTVTIFDLAWPTSAGGIYTPLDPCRNVYGKITDLVLSAGNGITVNIYDMEQLGNSLYVLAVDSTGTTSYVFKVDVSGGLDTTTDTWSAGSPPTQVYCTDLGLLASRFLVVGKHIYAALHSDDPNKKQSLLAIDFDGIYTGGAHIESLRADQLDVTQTANIGGALNVSGSLEVGGSVFANGRFAGQGATPIGMVTPFAGATAPAGWLFCDGALKSRTTYRELFDVISNVYGFTTVNNFRVPNLKQSIPVGYDSANSPFDNIGHTAGSVDHQLTSTESGLVAHTHTTVAHTHASASGSSFVSAANSGNYLQGSVGSSDVSDNDTIANATVTVNAVGAASALDAHNNMQPYIVMNYIIYAGV